MCRVTQPFLHPTERIMVSRQHPLSSFSHFIATDCSILMMDERYPGYPVCHALTCCHINRCCCCHIHNEMESNVVYNAAWSIVRASYQGHSPREEFCIFESGSVGMRNILTYVKRVHMVEKVWNHWSTSQY